MGIWFSWPSTVGPIFTGDMLTFCEHAMRTVCADVDVGWWSSTAKPTACTGWSCTANLGDFHAGATIQKPPH
jgi:hypothetical protein